MPTNHSSLSGAGCYWIVLTITCLLPTTPSCAAGRLVEIVVEGATRTGAVVSHDSTNGWFQERDGRLTQIRFGDVSTYKPLGQFRPWSPVELRERLTQDFGRDYSVSSTSHYLVVTARGIDAQYMTLFENLYRQFVVTFAARGFRMHEPEFPLVAIVFPDEARFAEYCKSEGVQPQSGLRGYYLPSSNRVALYDSAAGGQTTSSGLDSTIIHEAVHQVAFNTGIHSRIGVNPKWVVEGLATAFEVPSIRSNDRTTSALERANRSRYRWFQHTRGERNPNSLADLVANDTRFSAAPLDAYADSWALTFFLLETRSADYTAYLKILANRDPSQPYAAAERLTDFQQAFGRDLSLLEARWLRFCDDLAATAMTASSAGQR